MRVIVVHPAIGNPAPPLGQPQEVHFARNGIVYQQVVSSVLLAAAAPVVRNAVSRSKTLCSVPGSGPVSHPRVSSEGPKSSVIETEEAMR